MQISQNSLFFFFPFSIFNWRNKKIVKWYFSCKYCFFLGASSSSCMQCVLNFRSMLIHNTLYTITFIFFPCTTWHSSVYRCMQGFLDSYHFSGNIQNRHKQIGNAVPPPLAFVLGLKLKEAVDAKSSSAWLSHGCLLVVKGCHDTPIESAKLNTYTSISFHLFFIQFLHINYYGLHSMLEAILSGFMFSQIVGSQVMAIFSLCFEVVMGWK